MAHPHSSSPEGSSLPMLECPKCRWRAAAPANWVAPFAICPRCECKIANPDANPNVSGSTPRAGKVSSQQRMPAGYEFSYSESSRRRTDAWIKYAVMVGVAAVAIGGTFWAISKQAKNSKPAKAQSIYELAGTTGTSESPVNNSPIESNGNTAGGLPGEPGVLPSGSIEWDPQSVFNSTVAPEDEESLWNATGARDEPLAPPSSSDFRDPSIPSFDGFK